MRIVSMYHTFLHSKWFYRGELLFRNENRIIGDKKDWLMQIFALN